MKLTKKYSQEQQTETLDMDFGLALNISARIDNLEKQQMQEKNLFIERLIKPMKEAICDHLWHELRKAERMSEEEIYNQYMEDQK